MSFAIQAFSIRRLHDTRDYRIPIHDNTIVMVGVNGLGKTTVVNLLYLLLSRQWDRALEYSFDAVSITINGVEYVLSQHQDRESRESSLAQRLRAQIVRMDPNQRHRGLSLEVFERLATIAVSHGKEALAIELDRLTSISKSMCRNIAYSLNTEPRSFDKEQLATLDAVMKDLTAESHVLYLPTYRRIEKDLSLILPGIEESARRLDHFREYQPADSGRSHIELVEFGMEDVEATFRQVQSELVQKARIELNTLAGSNLRDVIRGQGDTYALETFRELDNAVIDRILNRVQERTLLDDTDKSHLREVISKLQSSEVSAIEANDKYIAHFFSKLVAVDAALSEREQRILRFSDVCNQYLSGKEIVYDDKASLVGVRLTSTGKQLPLRSLSSGEKQIVSLFSHLYLRSINRVCVIIDEPELSLSVTWQQRLLPDILESGSCVFLAAVTHSPFIFKNKLDSSTIDLSECITEASQ